LFQLEKLQQVLQHAQTESNKISLRNILESWFADKMETTTVQKEL
jgi:hypothetical protein